MPNLTTQKRDANAALRACEARLADPNLPAGEKIEEAARRERLLDRIESLCWREVGL